MSAPNAGRQSPDPETQHGSQGTDAQAKPNNQGAGPAGSANAGEDSAKTRDSLPSNPQDKKGEEADSKSG